MGDTGTGPGTGSIGGAGGPGFLVANGAAGTVDRTGHKSLSGQAVARAMHPVRFPRQAASHQDHTDLTLNSQIIWDN